MGETESGIVCGLPSEDIIAVPPVVSVSRRIELAWLPSIMTISGEFPWA
jgi:hypothetical protein